MEYPEMILIVKCGIGIGAAYLAALAYVKFGGRKDA